MLSQIVLSPHRLAWLIPIAVAALPVLGHAQPGAAYTPREATQVVSSAPRSAYLGGSSGGQKFSPEPTAMVMSVSNPYLELTASLLSRPRFMQCQRDGSLILAAEGDVGPDSRTRGTGWWQVDPRGAVRALLVRSTAVRERAMCGVSFQRSDLQPAAFAMTPEGELRVLASQGVYRVDPGGQVSRLAGDPDGLCTRSSQRRAPLTDGDADTARFHEPRGNPVLDGEGHLWLADQEGCALRRISPQGQTRTVVAPERVCAKDIAPADRPAFAHLSWDAHNGELVSGGAVLTHNQLFTTVWRIRLDGQVRRVLLAHKLGRSPAGAPLDGVQGLTVDAQGRIHIASRNMEQDVPALFRLDEAKGRAMQITGTRLRPGAYPSEAPLDGPADRARFLYVRGACSAGDGSIFVIDDLLVRRLDPLGRVSTWVF